MKKLNIFFRNTILLLLTTVVSSCNDMLDVDLPSSEFTSETVFESDITAEATVNGMYKSMVNDTYYNALHIVPGQTSDELILNSLVANVYTANDIPETDGYMTSMWGNFYSTIYNANTVIEGIQQSASLTASSTPKWLGEAYFLRAYCYFYMVNMWGEVPLITTTNVDLTALAPNASEADIYAQINEDLIFAIENLPENYDAYNNTKVRATKWAASALMARVQLYQENYDLAITYASNVIDSGMYQLVTDLSITNSPFIADNTEAILQIPYFNLTYTYEGSTVFNSAGGYLLRNGNTLFDANDARYLNWTLAVTAADGTTYRAPNKYKNAFETSPSERSTILRLAEVYLIRAEARAQTEDYDGALSDLNTLRNRANLSSITYTSTENLFTSISLERERELFAENGHRWFDLKRTHHLNDVLSSIPEKNWIATDALYPIPQSAIRSNPNLEQNSGY